VRGGGEVAGPSPRRRRPSRSTLRLRALQIAKNRKAIEVALLLLNAWACVAGLFIIVQVQQRVGTLTRQVAVNASIPILRLCNCIHMSSLHSCHWDWCRFTTVLHDDFVEHVVSMHLNKAEPVKRADISLIHHVEQGASGHSGESIFIMSVAGTLQS
jgi:hypothetical protein